MELTKELEKYYLEHKGLRCPFCKGDDIESTGDFNVVGNEVTQEVSCLNPDCRHTWTDLYKLQGILDDSVIQRD
jgi:hypothetical protein